MEQNAYILHSKRYSALHYVRNTSQKPFSATVLYILTKRKESRKNYINVKVKTYSSFEIYFDLTKHEVFI